MTKPMNKTETIKTLPLVINDETHDQNRQLTLWLVINEMLRNKQWSGKQLSGPSILFH